MLRDLEMEESGQKGTGELVTAGKVGPAQGQRKERDMAKVGRIHFLKIFGSFFPPFLKKSLFNRDRE